MSDEAIPEFGKEMCRAVVLFVLWSTVSWGHDLGCDGKPVPADVKASCCGQADAHQINAADVREDSNGDFVVTIGSRSHVFKQTETLPSSDGCYLVWYSLEWREKRATPGDWYCLRIPFGM